MDSRLHQAHLRSTNNIRASPALPLRHSPNPFTSKPQIPPLGADHKFRKGGDSSLNRTAFSSSLQAERLSTQKDFSSSRQDTGDFKSKTMQFSKGTLDVLSKASEILQKSSKITIGATPTAYTPGTAPYSNTNTDRIQFEKTAPASGQNPNYSTKTSNVLGRADEILKRSAAHSTHSHHVSNPIINKAPLPSVEIPVRPRDSATEAENRARAVLDQANTKLNHQLTVKPPVEKENKINTIFSRIDEALQRSLQITSNSHLTTTTKLDVAQTQNPPESRLSYDVTRKIQYETPPSRHPIEHFAHKEISQNQQSFTNINQERVVPHPIHNSERNGAGYQEISKKSHEIVKNSDENILKERIAAEQDQAPHLKSSFVMERRIGVQASSPFPETKKTLDESLSHKETTPPPAIYLPARTKKPKFVEEDYEDGTIYKGEKIKDAKHGRGEMLYPDGSRYEGEWEHDKRSGYGVQTFPNGNIEYDGEWKGDIYHGNGVLMNGSAEEHRKFDYRDFDTLENHWLKYEGEFIDGQMHGLGTLTLFNSDRYVGKFKQDRVHGAGVIHLRNGDTISAEWENNKLVRM